MHMGQVRNDHNNVMVLPTLDYSGVQPGQVIPVDDENVYHWAAGGFTPLTRYPVPHRLYPNHAHDPLAYALPEPDGADPSALAVGQVQDEAQVSPPQPAIQAASAAQTEE
jgi:hypothetical protein